jgi:hypothetical protein
MTKRKIFNNNKKSDHPMKRGCGEEGQQIDSHELDCHTQPLWTQLGTEEGRLAFLVHLFCGSAPDLVVGKLLL